MSSRYFDHAATTPADPRVVAAVTEALSQNWGNPNSIHSIGVRARDAVERARAQLAKLLNCYPEEILFTSGATEANNWILRAFKNAAISPVEHSSVNETAKALGLEILPLNGLSATKNYDLVSVMSVNNETGELLNYKKGEERYWHCDITQQVGKLPVNLDAMDSGPDFASLSAHKFYGPKGIGALYVRGGLYPEPLLYGGGQEKHVRSGTLNVPGIVGMGVAAEIAHERQAEDYAHAVNLRETVLEALKVNDFRVNANGSPFILSLSFLGVEGESIVIDLDREGYCVSSGAACSSGSNAPSHVLLAMGIDENWIRGTIRISFGRANTEEDAWGLGLSIGKTVNRLRDLG